MLIAPPSSSQGDQNRLGGPEKSLFECSLGFGREERPPIAVVNQALRTGSNYLLISVLLSVYEQLLNDVML